MTVQWAGLGPELLVKLDRSADEPLRVQLENELRDSIRTGRLAADERLPSSRELARDLGISRGLVLEAYSQLQAEGFLISRGGSATRVAPTAQEPPAPAEPTPEPPQFAIDFRPGTPDLNYFPRRDWAWAMREVLRTCPADAFGYPDPRGARRLREVLVAYLRRLRGVVADPERILICTGFAQGVNLVTRALVREGLTTLAFEDPGYDEHRGFAKDAGLTVLAVPTDEHGIDVDALAATGATAVVVTPAHQSPSGVLMAPERRQQLIEWASDTGGTIIEDDYDAEFRYDREPVGAVQGLAPDRVAALGTVSKSLGPGLRLGWVVCPSPLLDGIVHEKYSDDHGSPVLEQLALAEMIESGRFDKHLRRMRGVYGARRDILVEALRRHAPDVELAGLAAGFHAVARLPAGVDEQHVVTEAAGRSIKLYPMSTYRFDHVTEPPEIVLGFGNNSDGEIERGIEAIADLLRGES